MGPGMTKYQKKELLLSEAHHLLHGILRFHTQSVAIGKLEHLEESGIIDHEIDQARRFVEAADRICAEIDLITTKGRK